LLGDFGAASFHATADTLETRALQRIEVRAFGVCWGIAGADRGLSATRQMLEGLQAALLSAGCAGAAGL
jgi:hypothetical protein